MYFRKHTFMRLDGSSKISERRDMVADFQNRFGYFLIKANTYVKYYLFFKIIKGFTDFSSIVKFEVKCVMSHNLIRY